MLPRPVLVAVAAAVLTVAPAAAATAQTYHHADSRHDLRALDASSSDITFKPAPDATEPDVRSLRITHGARKITVRMTFTDLTRTSTMAEYVAEVRTNEHKFREADVLAHPGRWSGRAHVISRQGLVRCRGLSHHIDYDSNVVTIGIPRTCLGKPRWVKVAAAAINDVQTTTTPTDGTDPTTSDLLYVDDAQSSTFRWRETWSPRIHQG